MRIILLLSGFVIISLMNSCVSYDQLLNYQDNNMDSSVVKAIVAPDIRIRPNDVLSIKVFGTDEETSAPFNVSENNNMGFNIETIQLSGYLVDMEGVIDFPVLGKIRLEGLTTSEAREKMRKLLIEYLKEPVVNLRLLNFRVTVSGEVISPGSFNITNERISIPDALALAGGLTDYANRSRIMVARESNGEMVLNRVNMQTSDFFTSEFYYLKQNDMIYVEPLKSKAGAVSDQTNKVVPIISAIGTLVAIGVALFK